LKGSRHSHGENAAVESSLCSLAHIRMRKGCAGRSTNKCGSALLDTQLFVTAARWYFSSSGATILSAQEVRNLLPQLNSNPRRWLTLLSILALAIGGVARPASAQGTRHSAKHPVEYTFEVVRSFPHDPEAFTQGLVYDAGFLYEGTGLEGRSSLRKVRVETGEILQRVDLDPQYFGEGVAIVEHKILQLTWKSQIGFVYDVASFRRLLDFSYTGEGWGLAANGSNVYMSDGSSDIRILDATTLREKRRIHVHDGAKPIDQLNELEFVEGQLFANVWQTDRIARISPQTGEVVGWIDLSGLLSPMYQLRSGAVLNGIAYDSTGRRLFVTGKLWPRLFQIRLVPKHR
jgi:glutamine cyclotransferase